MAVKKMKEANLSVSDPNADDARVRRLRARQNFLSWRKFTIFPIIYLTP